MPTIGSLGARPGTAAAATPATSSLAAPGALAGGGAAASGGLASALALAVLVVFLVVMALQSPRVGIAVNGTPIQVWRRPLLLLKFRKSLVNDLSRIQDTNFRHRERSVAIHAPGLAGLPRRGAPFHEQLLPCLSLRAPTRNPWLAWHWIPDQVRDDNFRFRVRVRYRAGYGRLAMTILPLLNSGKINRTGHNWQFSG